ncbi:hypothetical protein LSAT2_001090, partial [Lamellibrachia satsuma]
SFHRKKLKVFNTSTPKSVSQWKQQVASLKNDLQLFSQLYIGCQMRAGNLQQFFRRENQACPAALSDGGSLRLGMKNDLLTCSENYSDAQSETPAITYVVVDGAVIVQVLKPAAAQNFDEYAQEIFIPHLLSTKLQTASRLDLMWDIYIADSLKGRTRAKHEKGVRRHVVAAAAIHGNWQNFLRVNSNKTELFRFISEALLKLFEQEDKQLVITDGEAVLSKSPLPDLAAVTPCRHEEADSRMLLHASHVA